MLLVLSGVPGIAVLQANLITRFLIFGLLGAYIAAIIVRAAGTRQLDVRTLWFPWLAVVAGIAAGMLLAFNGLLQYQVGEIAGAIVTAIFAGGGGTVFAAILARLARLSLQRFGRRRIAGLILTGALFAALAADAALALSVQGMFR